MGGWGLFTQHLGEMARPPETVTQHALVPLSVLAHGAQWLLFQEQNLVLKGEEKLAVGSMRGLIAAEEGSRPDSPFKASQ